MLLGLRPDACFALIIDLDVDDIGSATHGAVFDVSLLVSLRKIQRDDDFLTA